MLRTAIHRFRSLRISRRDFVAEIGSGNDPYWRSDLLIDKYIADATERPGGVAPLILDRSFVVGDALGLPLKDKAVDFLIARNILEHIAEAEAFVAEMMRVSKRGYITTPSVLAEKVFGWSKHVWFVQVEEGTLQLRAKDETLFDQELSRVFHGLYASNREFQRFYNRNRGLFVTELLWQDQVPYQIARGSLTGQDVKTAQASFDLEATRDAITRLAKTSSPSQILGGVMRRAVSTHRPTKALDYIDRLACPGCHSNLELKNATLVCVTCEARYPVANNVPILVSEAMVDEDD